MPSGVGESAVAVQLEHHDALRATAGLAAAARHRELGGAALGLRAGGGATWQLTTMGGGLARSLANLVHIQLCEHILKHIYYISI